MQLTARTLAAFAALALVAACSESPVAPEAPAAAPAAEPTTGPAIPNGPAASLYVARTVAVAGCAGTTLYLSADEKRTLDLHNAKRASLGLAAFCVDAKLTAAARSHSDEMIDRSYFSHNSFDGSAFNVRVTGFGYTPFTALAENIAFGSGSYGAPDAIFSNWMNSAGHRANIQNGTLRQIGIGVSAGTYQGYTGSKMYTVDFGTR